LQKGKAMKKPSETNPMAALNPIQTQAMQAMFAVATETMQFLSTRIQQDIETQQAMLACKSFEELQRVQAEFHKKTLEDYSGATAKMMKILTSGASDGLTNAASTWKRAYDDVPL
jgi:hypothetical protein